MRLEWVGLEEEKNRCSNEWPEKVEAWMKNEWEVVGLRMLILS